MVLQLTSLPVEVISNILNFLLPEDKARVDGTCHFFSDCCRQDVLWRDHCKFWQNWNPDTLENYKSWREKYIIRTLNDKKIQALVDTCLKSPDLVANTSVFQKLANTYGQEALEALWMTLDQTPDEHPEVLAKRWWANEMLLFLQRCAAMKYFLYHMNSPEIEEEMILETIEMLVRRDCRNNYGLMHNQIAMDLDDFEKWHPEWETDTPRGLAIQIVEFMTEVMDVCSEFDDEYDFHDPLNNLIGYTLNTEGHPGLPITHATIFCAFARRLNLNAKVIGYPKHVYVVVYPPEGMTLDGKPAPTGEPRERMFVDPSAEDGESIKTERDLLIKLNTMPIPSDVNHAELLEPVSPEGFVRRVMNNMIRGIQIRSLHERNGIIGQWSLEWFTESAFDGIALANFCESVRASRTPTHQLFGQIRRQDLDFWQSIPNLAENAPWNAMIARELLQDSPFSSGQLVMPTMPRNVIVPKSRSNPENQGVKYKVGTMFTHQRYGYDAAIVGWDARCSHDADWQAAMGVENLTRGPNQPFYRVIDDDGKERYVAEDNIEPGKESIWTEYFVHNAGRFFLRWDDNEERYISNLKQEYPDD